MTEASIENVMEGVTMHEWLENMESPDADEPAILSLSAAEFEQFRKLIHDIAGIALSPVKQALVAGRLAGRVRARGARSFAQYYRLLRQPGEDDELQFAVDLLTTNETYFFREPQHFAVLAEQALAARTSPRAFRVLSAASSSGEEAYSIAMTLADTLGQQPWEVVGLDISLRMVQRAVAGKYPLERTKQIPENYLRKYCLRGIGKQAGTLQVDPKLRQKVSFCHANLTRTLPQIGQFDVIFLRNVLIYFGPTTKKDVVERLVEFLVPDGLFFSGHSESLNGITDRVVHLKPAIYRKARR